MGQYKRQRNKSEDEKLAVYNRQTPFYPLIKNKLREKGWVYFCALQPNQKASFFGRVVERVEQQKAAFADGEDQGKSFFVEPYTLLRTFY